jgi:hypothetical protein
MRTSARLILHLARRGLPPARSCSAPALDRHGPQPEPRRGDADRRARDHRLHHQALPDLSREEAYMIASIAVDYHVTQVSMAPSRQQNARRQSRRAPCRQTLPDAYGATIRNGRPPVRRAMNSAVIFAPKGIAP